MFSQHAVPFWRHDSCRISLCIADFLILQWNTQEEPLKKGWLILSATQLEGVEATTAEGGMVDGVWSGWSHCTRRQEAERGAMLFSRSLFLFSLFNQSGSPIYGMVLQIFRIHLSSSVRCLCRNLGVFSMSPHPVRLTMKIPIILDDC